MNFRPTIGKVIGSIVFVIILFWIPLFFIKDTSKILDIVNLSKLTSTGNIIIFIIEVIFIYLFFSLFHKKKNKLLLVRENDLKRMMQNNPNIVQNNQQQYNPNQNYAN